MTISVIQAMDMRLSGFQTAFSTVQLARVLAIRENVRIGYVLVANETLPTFFSNISNDLNHAR